MLKSHVKFHSANGKRLVLVVDDERINQEMLKMILMDEYEILTADSGEMAWKMIHEYANHLSLILLDLNMPGMSGIELLRRTKADADVSQIPVIVVTSDATAEVQSLTEGAIDFIPKPYPQPGVIKARILRTIELSEDRQIINSTERDPLTGLYNREYFYRYAEQFDQYHENLPMDAIVLDVNHFHMINERFGNAYGDEVLTRIGQRVREMVIDTGGIVCRRAADTFMVYCPHGKDYEKILENSSIGLSGDNFGNNRVRLRMGVYQNVDKSLNIERRFDRAKMAADQVRNSYTRMISVYDENLHAKELYTEQLIEDFQQAIQEHQFQVFYQPKFDVRPEIPVLSSAEALVRWKHPELGMISPGVFIPLFEDNGLIQKLDYYVWEEAASQIRDWKIRFGITCPVSVNVSRIDMYDPHLIENLQNIVRKNQLETHDFLLEITESAYTQESEQIIETVNELRALGFRVEMDDFGTGYSSLSMISTLPIDALKLDMQFIRNAFNEHQDTRMLEVIIDIADYLSVPVIAEGVETEEQLKALKAMGCDMVQGYYFSRPVPPEEYEQFVIERSRMEDKYSEFRAPGIHRHGETAFGKIAHALSSGFESIYYVDLENNRYVEFRSEGKYEDLQIENSGENFFAYLQQLIRTRVDPRDQDRVMLSLAKEALYSQIQGNQPFTITFRTRKEDEELYYSLKAVLTGPQDQTHMVVGLSNVDEQMRQANLTRQKNPLNFEGLAKALSSDMETIFYVDIATDTYRYFSAPGEYINLPIEYSGVDFFKECAENIQKVVYSNDRRKLTNSLEKNRLLYALRERGTFTLTYRLAVGGLPVYYRMKAVWAEEEKCHHIIIGVTNINDQITEEEKLEIERQNAATYASIAQALSQDYFSIYYVNSVTEQFIEYSSSEEFSKLGIEKSGDHFFELSRRNLFRVIYPEDRDSFLKMFTKENILEELQRSRVFSLTYRLVMTGGPTYVNMKITRMPDVLDPHLVVGISNVQADMMRRQENVTYSSIALALAADYFSVYYVDSNTDSYLEYRADEDNWGLAVQSNGTDFFRRVREEQLLEVYHEDEEMVSENFTKEAILQELSRNQTYTVTYRAMIQGKPTFVHMKVTRMTDPADPHLVIGISNVDEQMRREQEHRKVLQMVNQDALTGVKSKHAYDNEIRRINADIQTGQAGAFGIVLCDVNGLKNINDTQGHQAGDEYLRRACGIICRIFSHSPVYRIGGDEFAVLLRGSDFETREDRMAELVHVNQIHMQREDVTIAGGLAVFQPETDKNVESVFTRADQTMYDYKNGMERKR